MSRVFATIVVRLRWLVIAAWIAAAAAATLYLPSLQEAESIELSGLVPEDAEAVETGRRSAELFPVPVTAHTAVVQRDPEGLSTEAQARVVERAVRYRPDAEGGQGGVAFALPLVNTLELFPGSEEDGTTAVTFLFFEPDMSIGDQAAAAHEFAEREVNREDDALVGVTGAVPARLAEWNEIEEALPWVSLATIAAIALILALNYRALLAPVVTLLAAAIAYLVSVRVAAWVGERTGFDVPSDIEPVMVVLLLGIVTDYAVFFLSGMRRRLLAGEEPRDAAHASTAQNLPIVVTAGLIVAAGAASLLAGRIEFFRAFGPGAALTVLVSLVVAVTLVPALLAVCGRRLFWPSLAATEPESKARPRSAATWGERLARFAALRPVSVVVLAVVLGLVFLASRGLAETNLGFTAIRGLPDDAEEKRAAVAAGQGFADGILAPTVALVEERTGPLDTEALGQVENRLAEHPGVAAVVGPGDALAREVPGLIVSEEAPAARYLIVLEDEPHGGPAIDTLESLREALPGYLQEAGLDDARAAFTGETALAAETVRTLTGDIVRIALAAFAVNFVLLVLFLRAIVAPLYLLLASALAFAATLGLTTLVFQELLGHGELTYYVPFAVAVLLLSLGSDYNVFLVGRIWQEAERGRVRDAIATAAPRASRTIAIAGLALAVSFAMLAIVPLRQFREFAFAMSVGVLLDAFLIRSLVVPALVSVFGELSWWPSRRRRRSEAVAEG
jgi:RND superfamily putative drug exporter